MAEQHISEPDNELAQDFNFFSIFKFVFPSIFTFVFIAVYQMVDGIFIERYVGELAITTPFWDFSWRRASCSAPAAMR